MCHLWQPMYSYVFADAFMLAVIVHRQAVDFYAYVGRNRLVFVSSSVELLAFYAFLFRPVYSTMTLWQTLYYYYHMHRISNFYTKSNERMQQQQQAPMT